MEADKDLAEYRANEEQMALKRARLLGLPYIDTSSDQQKTIFKDILGVDELRSFRVIPMRVQDGFIDFAITVTTPQNILKNLRDRFPDKRLSFSMISDTGFREYMLIYDPPKKIEYRDIQITAEGNEDLIKSISDTISQVRSDDMFAYIVQQAHRLNASDIHLESQQNHIRIRIRIDGVLHTIARLSPDKYRTLVGTIAVEGNVSTSSPDPQQGHISKQVKMADGSDVRINMRIETVPTVFGMDIVMRLFNMQSEMYNLDKLGLSEPEKVVVADIINKPTGLVLMVGPTGSGKTTTLYSMLNSLNTDARKIITLEDPVEYQFPGISQVTVATKNSSELKFADHLRAVLRLDPDIVMVGEIRDLDTAKTALQASLTGHMVLSTFHASSAAAALTRLMDVIGENPLYLSAIRLVMAQRLVRKLDDTTKQPTELPHPVIEKINSIISSMPETNRPDFSNVTFYKPGASVENPFGYKGQIALREQLTVTKPVRELLTQPKTTLSTSQIEEAAIAGGMRTMLHNGIDKLLAGETTVEELFRVLG